MKKDKTPDFNESALSTAIASGRLTTAQRLLLDPGSDTLEGREAFKTAAQRGELSPDDKLKLGVPEESTPEGRKALKKAAKRGQPTRET